MAIQQIHHLTFVVEKLDEGIERFEKIFGQDVFVKDELPQRGALTARTKIGAQWFVLVQHTDPDLPPGKHLKEKGEGFFLLSLQVEHMDNAVAEMAASGLSFTSDNDRQGLLNWQVRDLDPAQTLSVQVQLCEERD